MAALGATEAADPSRVSVPTMTERQVEMLLTHDPMFSKPQLDRQAGRGAGDRGGDKASLFCTACLN